MSPQRSSQSAKTLDHPVTENTPRARAYFLRGQAEVPQQAIQGEFAIGAVGSQAVRPNEGIALQFDKRYSAIAEAKAGCSDSSVQTPLVEEQLLALLMVGIIQL
jgi:hypothetical protein